jgi:dTDP-4-amino-4,6-dideoxygalactose transaminase
MDKLPFAKPYMPLETREIIEEEIFQLLQNVEHEHGSARISNGENVEKLEEVVAKMSGADHAVACASCTQAMVLGLGACGVKGDGYTQSFTWDSTAISMTMQGTHVNMKDIDLERWTVPAYDIGADPRTGGGYAVAVDTFGLQYTPVSYVPLFFDRAHSMGLRFRQLGLASFLSMSPSKIVTAGEGGIILSNREKFVKAMIMGRDIMCRMPETNAIIGLNNLKNIGTLLEWKRDTYNFYKQAFPEFIFQKCAEGESNHQVIGMLLDSHDQQDKLREVEDIELKFYYEPLHKRSATFEAGQLPNTMSVYERIVCLPSWYGVDREYVVNRIKETLEV